MKPADVNALYSATRERVSALVQDTPWLEHLIRAGGRYNRQRGDYYAAGITYFTVLAIFPLVMVGYSIAAFVLTRHPEWLSRLHNEIISHVPGEMGTQIDTLLDRAVNARTTVGAVGLLGGVYAGMGWIANMRAALTAQWDQRQPTIPWWREKLSDLTKFFGLLLVLALSLGLSAVRSESVTRAILRASRLEHTWGAPALLQVGSMLLALATSCALFTWVIARLPREPLAVGRAIRAGVLAALVFEVFKQLGGVYLARVLRSPAGAVFGPVIGVMVFAYFTYRILLFATAWAATATATATGMGMGMGEPDGDTVSGVGTPSS